MFKFSIIIDKIIIPVHIYFIIYIYTNYFLKYIEISILNNRGI